MNDRKGSLAEVGERREHLRCTRGSGLALVNDGGPLSECGLMHCSKYHLYYITLALAGEQRRWHAARQRLGSLQVDRRFEFGRLLQSVRLAASARKDHHAKGRKTAPTKVVGANPRRKS